MDLIYILKLKMILRFLKLKVNIQLMIKKKNFFVDAKAMNTLYYALIRSEFNKITSCKNVRDIWHALE